MDKLGESPCSAMGSVFEGVSRGVPRHDPSMGGRALSVPGETPVCLARACGAEGRRGEGHGSDDDIAHRLGAG
jgi:hypothetical protein